MVNVKEIENRLRLRFLENYEFIMEKIPSLRAKLQKRGNLDWRVIVENDGSINALIGGKKIYAYDAKKLCKDQVENFARDPRRLIVPVKKLSGKFPQIIHEKYMRKLQDMLFRDENELIARYIYDGKNIPLLIVFGIGLGYHIIELLNRFNIQHIIAIELNPDIFKMSLSTIDWRQIYNYFSVKGRTFTLLIGETLDELREQFIEKLMFINAGFHVYMFIFEHFRHKTYSEFFDWMVQEIAKQPLTWGFFDDEVWSIEHTLANIKQRIPLFTYPKKFEGDETPVFVVGSGPSLDKSIHVIEKYKDNAIVISCGTGLSSLYRKGIVPDIHVEIERTKSTYDFLCELDRKFLKQIDIVGFNNLYPKIFKLGNRNFMALKGNDAGALLFPQDLPFFYNSNPTVTAFGVALAAQLGFKNIYLFGVDLGVKDKNYHHSKLSFYYAEKSVLKKSPATSLVYDMETEGYLQDTVYTNIQLYVTKRAIENNIQNYNLNVVSVDGIAKIKGANFIPSEKVFFKAKIDKDLFKDKFYSSFSAAYTKWIKPESALNKLIQDFNLYSNIAIQLLGRVKPSVEDLMQLLSELHLLYIELAIDRKVGVYIMELLRGSVTTITKYMLAGAFSDHTNKRDFSIFCYDLLRSFIREANQRIKEIKF